MDESRGNPTVAGVPVRQPSTGRLRAARTVRFVVPLLFIPLLLGLVGNGPLSLSSVSEADTTITYERFARQGGPWTLLITTTPPPDGPLQVAISQSFHDSFTVQAISPQPTEVSATAQQVLYRFAVDHSAPSVQVSFDLKGDALWSQHAQLRVSDHRLTFDQFLYP